ncbi:hypothetical protein LguiA_034300 [Lonicera macranthoides]
MYTCMSRERGEIQGIAGGVRFRLGAGVASFGSNGVGQVGSDGGGQVDSDFSSLFFFSFFLSSSSVFF